MKAFLFVVIICTVLTQSKAQETITWTAGQPLQWCDFAGPVKDTSRFDAESFAEVRYNYKFNSTTDFSFDVYAKFDKSISWCKKQYQSEALLKHEQVHFDIAALYAQKLKEAFENFSYSNDFKNEIVQIFNQKKTEYHLMQQLYDDETNHSLNILYKKDWEKAIAEQLSKKDVQLNLAKK